MALPCRCHKCDHCSIDRLVCAGRGRRSQHYDHSGYHQQFQWTPADGLVHGLGHRLVPVLQLSAARLHPLDDPWAMLVPLEPHYSLLVSPFACAYSCQLSAGERYTSTPKSTTCTWKQRCTFPKAPPSAYAQAIWTRTRNGRQTSTGGCQPAPTLSSKWDTTATVTLRRPLSFRRVLAPVPQITASSMSRRPTRHSSFESP